MILWTKGEAIEGVVKRDVPISERGSIATLNDLPAWMVEEARAIARESRLGAVRYLTFYVATHVASSAEDFVEEVLRGTQTAATWGIQDRICLPRELTYATALEIRYADVLGNLDGERWFRVKPRQGAHPSDTSSGAVGVLRRQLRYCDLILERADVGYLSIASDDIEPVSANGLDISIRRWIAHRLAWWARSYLQQNLAQLSGEDLIAAVPESDMSRVTADAKIAAHALAREGVAYGDLPEFLQRAGFVGPDDWYHS